ncbi:hypothetical protein JTB14_019854 [Gonioctena quinquepunctata]|nr:hypothetical protein JTB14_019854 [Gonioctena quinquepunctata]
MDRGIIQGLKEILKTEFSVSEKADLADELFIKYQLKNVDIGDYFGITKKYDRIEGTLLLEGFVRKLGDKWRIRYQETLSTPKDTGNESQSDDLGTIISNIEVSNRFAVVANPDLDEQYKDTPTKKKILKTRSNHHQSSFRIRRVGLPSANFSEILTHNSTKISTQKMGLK